MAKQMVFVPRQAMNQGNSVSNINLPPGTHISEPESQKLLLRRREPLFSRVDLTTLAGQNLTFFSGAPGQTEINTNLRSGNTLPKDHKFIMEGVGVKLAYGMPEADVVNFYNNALLKLRIGSKDILNAPLSIIPSAGGLKGEVATTENDTRIFHVHNVGPDGDGMYLLLRRDPNNPGKFDPWTIEASDDIVATIVIAAPAVFTAASKVTLFLFGDRDGIR